MIEKNNAFKADDVRPDLDWGESEKLGNLGPTGRHVVLTRIRRARSIKGYPFNPAMSEILYCGLKRKVSIRQRWIYKRTKQIPRALTTEGLPNCSVSLRLLVILHFSRLLIIISRLPV